MEGTSRLGWAYWAIAIVSLLWNAFGAFDYYMTQSRNAAYLSNFPADMMPFLDAMPVWVTTAWAVGVWGSLLGSILLLLRSHWAVTAFALSLLGLAVSTIYQISTGLPASMTTPAMLGVQLSIWVALIFLLWFAMRSRTKGYLR